MQACSQRELPQLGQRVSDHWTSSSFALGGCAEKSGGHGAESCDGLDTGHWTLDLETQHSTPRALVATMSVNLRSDMPEIGDNNLTPLSMKNLSQEASSQRSPVCAHALSAMCIAGMKCNLRII